MRTTFRLTALRRATRRAVSWHAGMVLATVLTPARADIPDETLSTTLKAHKDAVLFLGGTLKYLCGRCSKDHDLRVLSTAVVVDAGGLLMAARMGALVDPKSEIKESHLHVVMADGAEVPVRVTVTDHDLGVLMLSVEKPEDARAHPFKAVNLEAAAPAKALDDLVVLRRFDQRLGYAVQAFTIRVNAVDTKPRTTYLSADLPGGELPIAPCFSGAGRLVGFSTGQEAVLAAEEFVDLINQARRRQTQ